MIKKIGITELERDSPSDLKVKEDRYMEADRSLTSVLVDVGILERERSEEEKQRLEQERISLERWFSED